MRKRGRRGGTVTSIILGGFLIFLVVSAIYYYVRSLDQSFAGSVTGTITTGVTSVTSSGSVTSVTTAAMDNMSLAQLQSLSFANSSKCDGLLDPRYWDTSIQASGKTTVNVIPNTVYGLVQSYNQWTVFFRSNMSNPPAWLSDGFDNYTNALVNRLAAHVMGTKNVTLAAAVMMNYTSYVGGLGATGVDFITFGGLSGLNVYAATGNIAQAAAATFPGQIYQLFALSQDCSYSEQQRAEFFGTAMSMTALIVATSGKDGFGPKFEALLTKLGIRDAWVGMKGYLKEISNTSPGAAYETTMVMAAIAKKFHSAKFADLASFTSSRIANMVQVLKEKGLSSDEIAQKVAELTKAVEESDDQNHVADVADKISYEYEGSLRVTIDSDLKAVLSSQGDHPRSITASFMASIFPGFKMGEVTAVKVTVHKLWMELQSYHVYQGGESFDPTLPKAEVQPGDVVGLSFELLPVEDFAKSIPDFTLTNQGYVAWVADAAVLKDFKIVDGVLEFRGLQKNPWSSAQDFTLKGNIVKYPGVSNQYGGVYAQFTVEDYAGRSRDVRIRYDGFSSLGLQLVKGDNVLPVSLVSYDDFRLSIVYGTDNRVATIYIGPPSESIYSLSEMHTYSGAYTNLVKGKYTNAIQIDRVDILRNLEKQMLDHGTSYDLGRLGAEIAYVVGDKNLGFKDIILEEPAKGGRDLYTQDNKVAIQARLLLNIPPGQLEATIQNALLSLVDKLGEDYDNQPQMQNGYAILSYVDTDGTVRTIVLEVPRP